MIKLRSFAFMAYLVTITLVLGLIGLPILLFGKNTIRGFVKFWTRLTLGGLKLFTGMSYRLHGREHLPTNGALIAVNHQSMWETIALFGLLPKPVFFFKKELLNIPIYGWWMRPVGSIAIDRDGGAKALRAMQKQTKALIAAGEQVVVFPEGTRVTPGETVRYKPGVAGMYLAAEAPCIPIAHDSGRFWRHVTGEKAAGEITLRILPAIAPGLDRKQFLRDLQSRIDGARPDLQNNSLDHSDSSDD